MKFVLFFIGWKRIIHLIGVSNIVDIDLERGTVDALITLFTQYSVVDIVTVLVLLGIAIKCIGDLYDYIANKLRNYFRKEQAEEIQQDELFSKLDSMNTKLDCLGNKISEVEERMAQNEESMTSLKEKIHNLDDNVTTLNEQVKKTDEVLKLVQKRLQGQVRDKLIELHHRYVYEYGMIDDAGLDSMERTYVQYKAAGGNSFIETLMEEVRDLPRPALEEKKILKILP